MQPSLCSFEERLLKSTNIRQAQPRLHKLKAQHVDAFRYASRGGYFHHVQVAFRDHCREDLASRLEILNQGRILTKGLTCELQRNRRSHAAGSVLWSFER